MELLHNREVLLLLFRTAVLLVSEDYNVKRKCEATFLAHHEGYANPGMCRTMRTRKLHEQLAHFRNSGEEMSPVNDS